MRQLTGRLAKRFDFRRVFGADAVKYGGLTLPADYLRTGGPAFRNNDYYVQSAKAEAQRLIQRFGVTPATPLLDVGCGLGRLATGLLAELGEYSAYCGVDVDAKRIDWCTRHIAQAHPGFRFLRVDIKNDRYNPRGAVLTEHFRLPFATGEFKVIYLYSVLSHMLARDAQLYFAEFSRLLDQDGRVFLTAFAEQDVPDVTVNPDDYIYASWHGELHCVRYSQAYLDELFAQAGFRVDDFEYGRETDGQSAYFLSRSQPSI